LLAAIKKALNFMKISLKIIFFLLTVFNSYYLYADPVDSYDTINIKDLIRIGYDISTIRDFPIKKITNNSKKACLAVREDNENDEYDVMLLYPLNDSILVNVSRIAIDLNNIDPICHHPYTNYEDGYIVTECNWMKGIFFRQEYTYSDTGLVFIRSTMYDLNENVYKVADSAYKAKDPVLYCQTYMGAQFYDDYKYRVKEGLEMAHNISMDYYKNKEFKKAADLMLAIETECASSTDRMVADLFPDEFKKIWSDVTLFYLKAGKNNECINLSKLLIDYDPKLVQVYLQYGDALFNLNNIAESKEIYKIYYELMDKNGNSKIIPQRVIERMK